MRVNTFANSRTAFAASRGKAYPCYDIPLQAGMSIGMLLVSVELLIMLFILLFIPGDLAGSCFIGFAIGESLGAAALRVAGGIFTKIADIGSRPDEDRLQDQGRRRAQPRRDRRLHRRQRGRFGWTFGRRFRNLRRHRRRAHHLHPAGRARPDGAGAAAGLDLLHARDDGDLLRQSATSSTAPSPRRATASLHKFNFEAPLTTLVWLTSHPLHRPHLRHQLLDDSRPGRRRLACGGSSPRSSVAAPWPAR